MALLFCMDETLFPPPPEERPPRDERPPARDVLVVYVLASFLLIVLGSLLQELHLLTGLVISELAFVAAPPLLYTVRYRYSLSRTFALAPIRARTVWLTIVTTGAAFVLVGVIAALQELVLPRSEDYQVVWQQILQQFHELPLAATLLLVAVLPGVCEELLFRGFLLQGLRRRWSPWGAIVVVGVLFGAFHVDPYRFVPVSLLGMLFGYLVLKTGSILTGMVAHATNNSIAILISYAILTAQEQQKLPPQTTAESLLTVASLLQMLPMIAIALIVFIIGLRALRSTKR